MLRRNCIILLMILSALQLSGQAKFNNPLSHFGIGEDIRFRGHHLEMMGGLYGAYNHHGMVNVGNPASLGFLRLTAFDLAASAGSSNLDAEGQKERTTVGNLHHLTLAFPLRNTISEVLERKTSPHRWAMGFDLRTNSRVGYNVVRVDSLPDVGEVRKSFVGSGGTNTFGWINAYNYKNLSIGADIGVTFGSISNTREAFFLDIRNPGNNKFEDEPNITAFRWKVGAQYRYLLNKKEENDNRKRYATIGLYGNSSSNLSHSGNQLYRTIRAINGQQDTIRAEVDLDGKGVLPGQIGFGFGFQPDQRWYVGFNVELNNWADFESDLLTVGEFDNGFKVGAGASWVPDENAYGNYFKRVNYKAGIQFVRDGRVDEGTPVDQWRANLGMTMPFYYLRQISHVHLGFEYARVDATSILENYYGVTLGVTFNDNQWFLQRKFN